MKLFDLHCDTPKKLFENKESLQSNTLHISKEMASAFERYIQCAAVWSDKALSDRQCFDFFKDAARYFEKEAGGFLTNARQLQNTESHGYILTVEDSRLISDDPGRIDILYNMGVRVMTLLWSGKSSVGSAWNSEGSLTPIGREILERCFEFGIIPDISHANDTVSALVVETARAKNKPVIATHSNSRTVCPHKRNIPDSLAREIASIGGIIGISLYPPHLNKEKADISNITDHIRHYVNTVGTESVCMGCDFDGIDSTPEEIHDISSLPILYDALSKEFGEKCAESIFFNNAYNFFINNLPQNPKER